MDTQVHGTKLWLDLSAWCVGIGGGDAQAWGGPCVTGHFCSLGSCGERHSLIGWFIDSAILLPAFVTHLTT